MIGISFATVFIFFIAGLVFFGIVSRFLRHRKMMDQITDEVFRQVRKPGPAESGPDGTTTARDYSCDKCGASLDSETEISPSGDYKCRYCKSWSNIRK